MTEQMPDLWWSPRTGRVWFRKMFLRTELFDLDPPDDAVKLGDIANAIEHRNEAIKMAEDALRELRDIRAVVKGYKERSTAEDALATIRDILDAPGRDSEPTDEERRAIRDSRLARRAALREMTQAADADGLYEHGTGFVNTRDEEDDFASHCEEDAAREEGDDDRSV